MVEYILAKDSMKPQIIEELQRFRENSPCYLQETHPQTTFLPLNILATHHSYATFIDQVLLQKAMVLLAKQLSDYGAYDLLDPARVWVGIETEPNESFFGGFHHPNQGYRYLQQIALTSLSGAFSRQPSTRELRTLDLIRAYSHDTLHYNSYRLLCPTPQPANPCFYRLQYGINFRKWDGALYSARDNVRSLTTRNLGNIMEGATDYFAHQITDTIAGGSARDYFQEDDLIFYYVSRDCRGLLTDADILQLRRMEKDEGAASTSQSVHLYLKSLRLFVQYVNIRYHRFLAEFDPEGHDVLHHLIIAGMLSGKMKELCQYLDVRVSRKRSFVHIFKSSQVTY